MATSLRVLRRVLLTAVVVLAGAACQDASAPPLLSPTAPTGFAGESGAAGFRPTADLGACLSAPAHGCFNATQTQTPSAAQAATSPPINLAATVVNSTVTLMWTPPSVQDAPVLGYVIDVGSTPNFPAPDLASIDTFSSSTMLEASGVAPGTYYVRVRARNELGISAPSNEIQVVVGVVIIPIPGCPGPPRSLTGSGLAGTVSLSWQPPLSGSVSSYQIEAGTAPGAANIGILNNGLSTTFVRAGVASGIYYIRVRALRPGCAPSAASNEVAVNVTGGASASGGTTVTLTLTYSCNPCSGDPDNYSLNVDCVNGRCRVHRTSNATRSGTVTATVSGAGVHNVEVVAIRASWTLRMSGGMTPGSWRILFPSGGSGLAVSGCQISGSAFDMFTEFTVGSGTC